MNREKYEVIKNRKGFIAALDQSGGSSAKTLKLYGINENMYSNNEEMYELIHEMRSRVIKSKVFSSEHIIGVILFEMTINKKIDNEYTSDYLWNNKKIVSFLKIDKGLEEEKDGVQLMKEIPNLENLLDTALERNIFGTKMRSVIKEANKKGIEEVVKQQFEIAKIIANKGLVPIIEPEVDINNIDKLECEEILKETIKKELNNLEKNTKIMFKFSIPTVPNFYQEFIDNPNIVRVVALSGGYEREKANELLSKNNGMIASFSRALLQDLTKQQSNDEFDKTLNNSVINIYNASIN